MPRGDCNQVPNDQQENGGAWWREGFFDSGISEKVEIKFGTDCPSGWENCLNGYQDWSGGSKGVGYLIKSNLGYYDRNGYDLQNANGTLQKLHSTMKAEDNALGC